MQKSVDINSRSMSLKFRLAKLACSASEVFNGRRAGLDLDEMRLSAEKATGLNDWGLRDDFSSLVFLEGQRKLVDSITRDAKLSSFGRRLVKIEIQEGLEEFLRIGREYELLKSSDQNLRKPLFIIGWARTGSTLLHRLLDNVACLRAPKFWELDNLSASRFSPVGINENFFIKKSKKKLRMIQTLAPEVLKIHPISVDGPDECHRLLEPLFVSPQYCLSYHVPDYLDWVLSIGDDDLEASYSVYRDIVVRLMRGDQNRHWCTKTLIHLFFAPVLPKLFPDCRIVWLRRSSNDAIASFCSLIHSYRRIYSDDVNTFEIGRMVLDVYTKANERVARANQQVESNNRIVVEFDELVSDPLREIERICSKFSYDLTDHDMDRIKKEIIESKLENSASKHIYNLSDYGITEGETSLTMNV